MRHLLSLALFVPCLAIAASPTLSHQGRLTDINGVPLNGELPVVVRIMDDPDIGEGTPSATESQTVVFADGYYQVDLDNVSAADVIGERWLSVTVDGVEFPRQELHSVPYAVRTSSVTLSDSTQVCDASTTSLHGTLRFHADTFEGCTSEGWVELATNIPFSATGGTVVEAGGYRIHTFTSSGTFQAGPVDGTVDVLVVAGGGGGGGRSGGGGGAGGLKHLVDLDVSSGETFSVVIGAGGAGGNGSGSHGADGQPSSFGTHSVQGGGGGGSDNGQAGRSGGSGGGGRYGNSGGAGISGQGHNGGYGWSNPYAGGGGGGAGGPGIAGTSGGEIGDGGPGLLVDIGPSPAYYAGGGGGGSHNPANGRGFGGVGGGGTGGAPGGANSGASGTANTGGGGGAGSTSSGNGGSGGSGGSGIVIVRYPL